MKAEGRVWVFVEEDGELLLEDRLYTILVNKRVLGMLDEEGGTGKEKGEKGKLHRIAEENVSEGLETKKSMVNTGEVPHRRALRVNLDEELKRWKEGRLRELRENCLSSKLLVRTQRWKKDGVLLVRLFYWSLKPF